MEGKSDNLLVQRTADRRMWGPKARKFTYQLLSIVPPHTAQKRQEIGRAGKRGPSDPHPPFVFPPGCFLGAAFPASQVPTPASIIHSPTTRSRQTALPKRPHEISPFATEINVHFLLLLRSVLLFPSASRTVVVVKLPAREGPKSILRGVLLPAIHGHEPPDISQQSLNSRGRNRMVCNGHRRHRTAFGNFESRPTLARQ